MAFAQFLHRTCLAFLRINVDFWENFYVKRIIFNENVVLYENYC